MELAASADKAIINKSGTLPGALEIIAIIGFVIVVASTSLDFTPIVPQNWRAAGAGVPVAITCCVGILLMLRRNHFGGFFAAIFTGFFLTHEIIIIYDNKAVELGKELKIDGWFRPVLEVYRDAFSFNTGAYWALIGVLVAAVSICAGWVIDVIQKNNNAARLAEVAGSQSGNDPAEDNFADFADLDENEDSSDPKDTSNSEEEENA
ncbi:MAG: hypothetical protein PHD82_09060 [Candidatus Riflebacteria bacterium]|nr:hypothetical protein [Candidatus Riflebacteria bacterium]